MNFSKRRKRLNEMCPGAYRQKIGDLVPEVIRVNLAAGDISSGVATINAAVEGEICSVLVKSASGAVRAVTAFTHTDNAISVTATNIAAGDTVTMMFI